MAKVRIKICGVTGVEDIRTAADLGADAIGLNFYAQSPRYVDPRNAAPLLRAVPPMIDAVGVFVGLKTRQVCALAYQLGLRCVQVFGEWDDLEDPCPFRRITAFRINDQSHIDEMKRYLAACTAASALPAAILVDAYVEGELGGTGHRAPWHLLKDFQAGVPLILAGGLTPENVAEAIRTVRPYGVDVASGVESSPGKKDAEKMRRFIEAARGA